MDVYLLAHRMTDTGNSSAVLWHLHTVARLPVADVLGYQVVSASLRWIWPMRRWQHLLYVRCTRVTRWLQAEVHCSTGGDLLGNRPKVWVSRLLACEPALAF